MLYQRKIGIILCLAAFLLFGIAATSPKLQEPAKPAKRNLKVLPKDISHDDLDKVMDGFRDALGVRCDYCHAKSKDPNERRPDFASDDKPEKNIARKMMRMTAKINKQNFSGDMNMNEKGETGPRITCGICHHGQPHPEFKTPPNEDHMGMPGPPPSGGNPPAPGAPGGNPPPAQQ